MRYSTCAQQHFAESTMIQIRRKLGHAQIVRAKRNDRIGGNRFVPELMKIPDHSSRLHDSFSYRRHSRMCDKLVFDLMRGNRGQRPLQSTW